VNPVQTEFRVYRVRGNQSLKLLTTFQLYHSQYCVISGTVQTPEDSRHGMGHRKRVPLELATTMKMREIFEGGTLTRCPFRREGILQVRTSTCWRNSTEGRQNSRHRSSTQARRGIALLARKVGASGERRLYHMRGTPSLRIQIVLQGSACQEGIPTYKTLGSTRV